MNHHHPHPSAPGPPRGRSPSGPRLAVAGAGLIGLALLGLLVPAGSMAQVTDLVVIYGGSSSIQPPAGYTKLTVDLNQGADGDYIYVCYRKGVGAPITGLAVTVNSGQPPSDAVYTRINVDLNRGCGSETDDIWLWYTRDPACATIRDIHVQADKGSPPAGYSRIDVDLNKGAHGAFIYLSYRKL